MTAKQFRHPFTMVVSGSTGSGKTVWVMHLIDALNTVIENGEKENGSAAISSIFYCYGALNANVMELKRRETTQMSTEAGKDAEDSGSRIRIITHNGLPSEERIKEEAQDRRLLLVLDDLMVAAKSPFLDTLFTLGSHNWGVSVVLVTQHLFGKELRIARNNSHYIILLRNPAGALQIRNIASQLFPGRVPYFMEAYKDATEKPFSYLVIDMHPKTDEMNRLKTRIFQDNDGYTTIYVPKH